MIGNRVSQNNNVRRSVALLVLLVFFLQSLALHPRTASGQSKNISPDVISEEPPALAPPVDSGPPGDDSGPPGPWVIALVPAVGIVWWVFSRVPTPRPVPPPVVKTGSSAPTVDTPATVIVPCPTVSVSCPGDIEQGSPLTFSSSLSSSANVTYIWSVSAGTISSGQGSPSITVDTQNLGGQTVTATLELGGLDPTCSGTASCSTAIRTPIVPASKFDRFGDIRFDDEKARLDNYVIQLQNAPGAQGYIVAYGTCAGEAQARADRAKEYMIYSRGIDGGRLVTIDGGCRPDLEKELWVVTTGATPPAVIKDNNISPCPECKRVDPRSRTRRGRVGTRGRS